MKDPSDKIFEISMLFGAIMLIISIFGFSVIICADSYLSVLFKFVIMLPLITIFTLSIMAVLITFLELKNQKVNKK